MKPSNYLLEEHIRDIFEEIRHSPELFTYLENAISASELGEYKEGIGKFEEAIPYFLKSQLNFEKVPQAHYLLGICKTHLASCYGNIGDTKNAKRYAIEAVDILKGLNSFAFSEAMARMTLGNILFLSGQIKKGDEQYQQSRILLASLPNFEGMPYINVLDSNRKKFNFLYNNKSGCMGTVIFFIIFFFLI